MGRREGPLDPAEGPVARFAYELRKLRQEAGGITYRAMAAEAHYSAATLAQAAAGDRLPSLAVALAYIGACGGDREEWERRWHAAKDEASEHTRDSGSGGEPPYRGLARFGVGDHERFFGRDRLVDQLVELVGRRHLVVVTGPSGSGKSSLLRAGLIARLQKTTSRQERPTSIRILTPGPYPARTHTAILDPDSAPAGTMIVVDQLEEVFTLCADRTERTRFLDLLCAVQPSDEIRVVVAVRADFYGHIAQHRPLAEAAQGATLLVPPMGPEELREAIVRPAALDGLVVERALTARIVADVADEPGGLPLMSHALLETWRRRSGQVLTEAAYEAAGGISGAIARTADEVYTRLTSEQAQAARRILLRLVSPGQGNQDTRRPADRTEVTALGPGSPGDADLVLERLARARLITLDRDTVHLSHEAVLAAWPRLRAWIDEDRDRLRTQRHLTEAAATWHSLDQDPGSLYRGLRLSVAEEHWAAPGRREGLTASERQFLTASLSARERSRRWRLAGIAAVSVLIVLSLVAALAVWQQNQAGERRRTEVEARRVAGVSGSLRLSDPSAAMRLSLAAWQAADLPETRSALLAGAFQKEQDVFRDPDGRTQTMRRLSTDGKSLLSISADRTTRWEIATHRSIDVWPGPGSAWENVGFPRADARGVPVFDDTKVAWLDLATGRRTVLTDADGGTEVSPSGRTLIVYDRQGAHRRLQLWEPHTRQRILQIELKDVERAVEPSSLAWPHLMALFGAFQQDRRALVSDDAAFPDATLSPDDRYLALCVPGEQVQLWDVSTARRLAAPWLPKVSVRQCAQEQVVFSGDGSRLSVVDSTGIRTWKTATGEELAAVEHSGLKVTELSEDGTFAAASDGTEIFVWRLTAPYFPVFRHRLSGETVKDLRIDTRAGTLRYVGGPGDSWGPTVHSLTLGRSVTDQWAATPSVKSIFSPDGATLATAVRDSDGRRIRFRLFDGRSGRALPAPPAAKCPMPAGDPLDTCAVLMGFNSTGTVLAYGVGTHSPIAAPLRIALYDVPRRRTRKELDIGRIGPDAPAYLAFGPGDRSLILAGVPGVGTYTRIWDLRRRTTTHKVPGVGGDTALHPDGDLAVTTQGDAYRLSSGARLPSTRTSGTTSALAFSPDGEYLAAGDDSGRVVLWDSHLTQRLGVLAPDTPNGQYVSALAFSPDSGVLAVAGDEGALQLWDTASRQRIGSALPTPGDTVHALAFSPDGRRLYAAGDHTPLQSYDISPAGAARTICQRVTNGLPPSQWQRHLPAIPYRRTCP
ncbi:hypothetical protein [Streptomyces scabiei]|uniref:nSTAND1 domain-containing NTPase n=1 Tax=Streptomyces scabiei TaxID=1930 RepID=UPI0029B3D85E|nr:hypothetical protein [Streptomyces scabiei]MDX3524610.1 hypothetical protein [Streptomyces scabiei]